MVWGDFSMRGVSEQAFLSGRQNSECYNRILTDYRLPFGSSMNYDGWTFQKDNASIHTSGHTTQWFKDRNIKVMDWAAKSPDLNPIENLWGVLASRVYRDMRKFTSVDDFKACITDEWCNLEPPFLQKLVKIFPSAALK